MTTPNQQNLPKIDLTTFFFSLSSAAFMSMGITPPGSKMEPKIDLDIAKQNIDIFELIVEKTKGNRSGDEDRLAEQLLFQLRMHFVEAQKGKK